MFHSLSCTPVQIENTFEIAPPLQMHSFGRTQESGPWFGHFEFGTHWLHWLPDHPFLQIHSPG